MVAPPVVQTPMALLPPLPTTTTTTIKPPETTTTTAAAAATTTTSLDTYISLIQQYLACQLLETAQFWADRAAAAHPVDHAVYLQCLTAERRQFPHRARALWWNHRRRRCSSSNDSTVATQSGGDYQHQGDYLCAQCSIQLSDWAAAEEDLLATARRTYGGEGSSSFEEWIVQTTPCPVPNGAAGLALLAKIYRETSRTAKAIQYYKLSLQLDPFLWSSLEGLAELGVQVDGANDSLLTPSGNGTGGNHNNNNKSIINSSANKNGNNNNAPPLQPTTPAAGRPPTTPGLTPIPPRATPLVRARQVVARQYYPPSPETPVTTVTRSMRYLHGLGGSTTTGTVATSKKKLETSRSLFEGGKSSEMDHTSTEKTPHPEATKDDEDNDDVSQILTLLHRCAAVYQHLCRYECRETLASYQKLPVCQQETAWARQCQGRAWLEAGDFGAARRALTAMHQAAPGRTEGLEYLSTVLWQLKDEVALASLAQTCQEWDRLSPSTWCVVGNLFSLLKDHEAALVFFKRSLRLDANFTYTHTLSGYEYMANEDFEKATQCFRQALRTNPRHYNAWYGLGGIYFRQEKYDLAEYHFDRACQLHPTSSVLRCHAGMAQYANGKAGQALETLQLASAADPNNPQARFQRATIFATMNRSAAAVEELLLVRDAAPREAAVHLALGRLYKKLGEPAQALTCFLAAMDLDPKDGGGKMAMDKLDEDEPAEPDSMTPF